MKVSNIERTAQHAADISKGRVGTFLVASEDSAAAPAIEMYNASGGALVEGDVVVVNSAGQITTTSTAQDSRPTGVVLDDIDAADYGAVAFFGPVDLVNVTASVTAGQYAETSTTTKKATSAATSGNAFAEFTSSGTTPSAFLFGGRGGGLTAAADVGGSFDVTPPQTVPLPAWVKPTGSGVITADPQGRLTVDSGATYKGFPGLTFLEGRLHLVYRDGTGHNSTGGTVKYRTSDDLGRTWSSATTLVTPAGSLDCRDPFIVALSSGRLLVGYDLRDYAPTPDTITAHLIYSDDRGRNWSSAYQIPDSFSGQAIVTSQALELPDGRVLIPGFGDNGGFYISVVWVSNDGGATVSSQVTVASGSRDYEELQIRLLASGRIVGLMRDSVGAHTWRTTATPNDITTWTAPTDVLTMTGRPDFVEFFPNALLIFGRSASPDFAPRWAVSWDEGATWTALQQVDTGVTDEQEYAAPVVLTPGYVAVVYSIENSSTDADLHIRYYYDGYGMDTLGNVRALTVSPGATFATPAIVLGTAAAAGAASTGIRSDSTIVAFDATVPVTQAFSDTAATGSAAVAARRDHKHGMPAASGVGEILISDTPSTPLVFADLVQNEAQDDLVYADP